MACNINLHFLLLLFFARAVTLSPAIRVANLTGHSQIIEKGRTNLGRCEIRTLLASSAEDRRCSTDKDSGCQRNLATVWFRNTIWPFFDIFRNRSKSNAKLKKGFSPPALSKTERRNKAPGWGMRSGPTLISGTAHCPDLFFQTRFPSELI